MPPRLPENVITLGTPAFAARGDDQRALVFLVGDLGQSHVPSLGAATRAWLSHE